MMEFKELLIMFYLIQLFPRASHLGLVQNLIMLHAKILKLTLQQFLDPLDAIDTVLKEYMLPELEVNDWLVFPNMGAYTTSSGTNFNGFCSTAKDIYLACSSSVGQE